MQLVHVIRERFLLIMFACVAAGCGGAPELAPTPNLMLASDENPFTTVDSAFQSNIVPIIYATDRNRSYAEDGGVQYGYHRSKSFGVGVCRVQIGEDLTWDELVAQSRTSDRSRDLTMSVESMEEVLRFPDSPVPLISTERGLEPDPAVARAASNVLTVFQRLLSDRLSRTSRKEIFLFVHGYNNTIEDASIRWAQFWHFMGREGVPVVYSWPAGRGGLRGYTYDRESGEFTVYHFKQFLTELAACPDIEKIHIVAHSRGTDVVTTALRELNERHGGSEQGTRAALKLGHLVLAAADLDWEVMSQRIGAERLLFIPETFTFYISNEDKAIGFSQWLFASVRRIGDLLESDLSRRQIDVLDNTLQLTVVDVQADTGFLGHGYFISNPAVLSDLILVLRDGRLPGAEHGRPLSRPGGGFWVLDDNYLLDAPPE